MEFPAGSLVSGLGWRVRWGADREGCWRANKGFCLQLKRNGKPKERLSRDGHVCNIPVARLSTG